MDEVSELFFRAQGVEAWFVHQLTEQSVETSDFIISIVADKAELSRGLDSSCRFVKQLMKTYIFDAGIDILRIWDR